MEEKREKYRIAEFARMVGVDPSTVRYYEKHGLRGKKRDENGYRVFDQYDAFQMNAFRSLCARGYSLSEATKRMEPTDSALLRREMEENLADLEQEMLLLEGRRQWARETLRLLTLRAQGGELLWRLELEDFYYLPASVGDDFSITQKNGGVRKGWEEWLGYTRFVGLGDSAAFVRGERPLLGLGEAVRAGDFERLGYPSDQTVQRLSMGDCLCFPVGQYAAGRNQKVQDLVRGYLTQNGLEAAGNFLYFYQMLNVDGDTGIDSVVALPVRPRSEEE